MQMYIIMTNEQKKQSERLLAIRKNLKPRGDIIHIAQKLEVSRVWVSYVVNGHGTSERVLQEAERVIEARKN